MKVLLVLNQHHHRNREISLWIADRVAACGMEVVIDESEYWEGSYEGIDLVIVPGGDGSMIRAARRHLQANLLILGINLGKVGFLSQIELEDIERDLAAFQAGEFSVDERIMMEVRIAGLSSEAPNGFYALNDLFLRSSDGQVINIDLQVDGAGSTSFRGDGLIVTTPTGSTAYSLSCGGSIIEPALELFGITPVSSYLLAQRPIVLSAERQLELKVSNQRPAYVMLDGQIREEIHPNQPIYIKKAPWKLKMAHMKGSNFFAAVVDKRLKRVNS